MRKAPCTPPPINKKQDTGLITQTREYELITPLFGGGVEPTHEDPITVVRATAIRGHLRFWWRASRGGIAAGCVAKLKAKEDEIWGAAGKEENQSGPSEDEIWGAARRKGKDGKTEGGPSRVIVEVIPLSLGREFAFEAEVKKDGRKVKTTRTDVGNPRLSPYNYVAFPLDPRNQDGKEKRNETVLDQVSFELRISYPIEYQKEVEAALWAWETFGGIGARTRRGFGALKLVKVDGTRNTDLPPASKEGAIQWLEDKFSKHFCTKGEMPKDVPTLIPRPQVFIAAKVFDGPDGRLGAWRLMIDKLRSFRQHRTDKNTLQYSSYGHSSWPEVNAIRRLTEGSARGPYASRQVDKFPRGNFGLPLIFHLHHDGDQGFMLQGEKGKERLASPLIFRPLVCRDNKFLGLALLLSGTRLPDNLLLKGESLPKDGKSVSTTLTQKEAQEIPMLNGNPNVLEAFFDYLDK